MQIWYPKDSKQQLRFLFQITEVGTMNIFMYWINENGGKLRIFISL